MTPIALKVHDNLRKFLMLITFTEGTDREKTPYNELFGYTNFSGYEKHPEILIKSKNYRSTAAGRYQVLKATFKAFKKKFPNAQFTPEWQDKIAIQLIKEQGAYDDIIAGRWEIAISKTNDIWASLPGSPYGQPTKKLSECLKFLKSI